MDVLWSSSSIAFLASALVHGLALILLALLVQTPPPGSGSLSLTGHLDGPLEGDSLSTGDAVITPDNQDLASALNALAPQPPQETAYENTEQNELAVATSLPVLPADEMRPNGQLDVFAALTRPGEMLAPSVPSGGGVQGRRGDAKQKSLIGGGGSPQSELAVERGLRWLAAHQRKDGSWHFNHQQGACQGLCRNPGTEASTTAATSLALLAFLGAGNTHLEGEHKDIVRRGLMYLGSKAILSEKGADLQNGTMYGQGLSTIVLAESYALTQDEGLEELARQAIQFVVSAQDSYGGGWRYAPGQPGDMTVTGWQLMALKSGLMAGLPVARGAIYRAKNFLDSMEGEYGAVYGYRLAEREPRRTTTAIGLLMRMYTGWPRQREALQRGVQHLADWGPSYDDLYYDYYATQVMFHWGGPAWERWNRVMRDHLLSNQATEGHESGSWYYDHKHSAAGGRLYNTAMAVMILEVYYRNMPLYGRRAFGE